MGRTHSVASKAEELIEALAGVVVVLVRGAGRGRAKSQGQLVQEARAWCSACAT